jgi:hypothetical protein
MGQTCKSKAKAEHWILSFNVIAGMFYVRFVQRWVIPTLRQCKSTIMFLSEAYSLMLALLTFGG